MHSRKLLDMQSNGSWAEKDWQLDNPRNFHKELLGLLHNMKEAWKMEESGYIQTKMLTKRMMVSVTRCRGRIYDLCWNCEYVVCFDCDRTVWKSWSFWSRAWNPHTVSLGWTALLMDHSRFFWFGWIFFNFFEAKKKR